MVKNSKMKNTNYNNFLLKSSFLFAVFCFDSCRNESAKSDGFSGDTETEILFVGTYTQKEPHVDGKGEGIYVLEYNSVTGALSPKNKVTGTVNPSYLTPHPNGQFLYAVNEIGNATGTVSAFSVDPKTHQLSFLNKVSANGKAPCYIDVDDEGKFLHIANYVTGNVALLPIKNNGEVAEAVAVLQHQPSNSEHPRQETPHAHFFSPKRNSNLAYAVDLGLDKIFTYQIDTVNQGVLQIDEQPLKEKAVGGRHLAWHPKYDWMYVIGELNGTVEAFRKVPNNTKFTHFQTIRTLTDSTASNASSADIHITPNGKFLYASNRGNYNNLAMYRINQQNGKLTFLGTQPTKGKSPRNFVIAPDGKFLLVANQDSDNIVTFKINSETGILEDIGLEIMVKTPVCLKF